MAHVAEWKHGELEQLTKLVTENNIIGIANIQGIPAPQLQKMRANIRDSATLRCAKKTLIQRALDEAEKKNKGITALKDSLNGEAVIIATNMNPFKLFQQLKATRTNAPAKGGEIAPADIEVKEGDTPFKPGPVVGELQKVGIPAAIKEGKVVIKANKVIVPKGAPIPRDVAQMLTRLEIHPIEIGMSLSAVYEDGNIFTPDVLDIDMDQFLGQIAQASSHAFNLAVETGWTTKETIQPLINKAHLYALSLAIRQNILNKETLNQLLAKAHHSMLGLASHITDALDDDLKNKLT